MRRIGFSWGLSVPSRRLRSWRLFSVSRLPVVVLSVAFMMSFAGIVLPGVSLFTCFPNAVTFDGESYPLTEEEEQSSFQAFSDLRPRLTRSSKSDRNVTLTGHLRSAENCLGRWSHDVESPVLFGHQLGVALRC